MKKTYKKIIELLLRYFVCRGTHTPEKFVTETAANIYSYRCKRCKVPTGLPYMKGVRALLPKCASAESWNSFVDEKESNLRKGL